MFVVVLLLFYLGVSVLVCVLGSLHVVLALACGLDSLDVVLVLCLCLCLCLCLRLRFLVVVWA